MTDQITERPTATLADLQTWASVVNHDYNRAMSLAELAIDMMVQLAKNIDGLKRLRPSETIAMLEQAGFTNVDCRSLSRLMADCGRKYTEDDTDDVMNKPCRFERIATGCLHIGSMANARRGSRLRHLVKKYGAPTTKAPTCE
jgi:hypothetical protein